MNYKVDQDTCIGCGLCTSTCPSVYAFNDDGKAMVIMQPTEAEESDAQSALDSCPVQAISKE